LATMFLAGVLNFWFCSSTQYLTLELASLYLAVSSKL
jgi:hypothetical protein